MLSGDRRKRFYHHSTLQSPVPVVDQTVSLYISLVIFVLSLTFTIGVHGCAATCDAIWKTKVYYNKVFWFSEASQMAEQTTVYRDKDIFHMIVW